MYDEEDLFTVIKQMRDEGKSWKYTRVIKSLGTRKLLRLSMMAQDNLLMILYTHENVVIEPISKIESKRKYFKKRNVIWNILISYSIYKCSKLY